jgi:hypothetical protein
LLGNTIIYSYFRAHLQQGVIVSRIFGPNAPELEAAIWDNIPSAEQDQ